LITNGIFGAKKLKDRRQEETNLLLKNDIIAAEM
jgi:hypothetical protein